MSESEPLCQKSPDCLLPISKDVRAAVAITPYVLVPASHLATAPHQQQMTPEPRQKPGRGSPSLYSAIPLEDKPLIGLPRHIKMTKHISPTAEDRARWAQHEPREESHRAQRSRWLTSRWCWSPLCGSRGSCCKQRAHSHGNSAGGG